MFDHWFCSVPSQTWCNRAFWHAATSWGHVINGGGDDQGSLEWLEDSNGTTLFNSFADAALAWRIYSSNLVSLTGLIHFRALEDYHFTNFPSLEQFFTDCRKGQLAPYSFLEPNFWTPHDDQHPSSFDSGLYGPAAAGSVLLGENLINRVYDAVRTSRSSHGNNWSNTLLIITHDEHGAATTTSRRAPRCRRAASRGRRTASSSTGSASGCRWSWSPPTSLRAPS